MPKLSLLPDFPAATLEIGVVADGMVDDGVLEDCMPVDDVLADGMVEDGVLEDCVLVNVLVDVVLVISACCSKAEKDMIVDGVLINSIINGVING